jgi:hypothetical protein
MDGQTSWFAWVSHALGMGTIFGTLAGFLPPFAAFLAIGWYAIQIRESHTVRMWIAKRRDRRIVKLQDKLTAMKLDRQMYPTDDEKKSGPGA